MSEELVEPNDCCLSAWKEASPSDPWDAPDMFSCPVCGNSAHCVPWARETGIPGIKVDGISLHWLDNGDPF